MKSWLKGGLAGLAYFLLAFFVTAFINSNIISIIPIGQIDRSYFYNFVADFFVKGSAFYSGSILMFLYGIFIYPTSALYNLICINSHGGFLSCDMNFFLTFVMPILVFAFIGSIIGAIIGWITGKVKQRKA